MVIDIIIMFTMATIHDIGYAGPQFNIKTTIELYRFWSIEPGWQYMYGWP